MSGSISSPARASPRLAHAARREEERARIAAARQSAGSSISRAARVRLAIAIGGIEPRGGGCEARGGGCVARGGCEAREGLGGGVLSRR